MKTFVQTDFVKAYGWCDKFDYGIQLVEEWHGVTTHESEFYSKRQAIFPFDGSQFCFDEKECVSLVHKLDDHSTREVSD
jgi:hypothetical protein